MVDKVEFRQVFVRTLGFFFFFLKHYFLNLMSNPCDTAQESENMKHFAGDPGYIHTADVCTGTTGSQSSVWITGASFTCCLAYS
jgi:hypothetical protein